MRRQDRSIWNSSSPPTCVVLTQRSRLGRNESRRVNGGDNQQPVQHIKISPEGLQTSDQNALLPGAANAPKHANEREHKGQARNRQKHRRTAPH